MIYEQYVRLHRAQSSGNTTSKGKPGRTSDKKIFDERQIEFDPQQKFQGDKAYQGGKSITTPQKKPRYKELSPKDELRNKALACKEIVVEHLIRS